MYLLDKMNTIDQNRLLRIWQMIARVISETGGDANG
jgi:hypothetical protein